MLLNVTSTEARRPIRDGHEWDWGDRRVRPRNRRQPGRPRLPWTAARTKDCYGSVRPALRSDYTGPRNCCPNCYAEQSHKDSVRSSAVGKQLMQKKSNSLSVAQHHLPALDLFWASFFMRVQLTSLLLISPGLLQAARKSCDKSSCCYSRLYGAVIFRSRTEARNQAGVIA